jgi:hypothetical protein
MMRQHGWRQERQAPLLYELQLVECGTEGAKKKKGLTLMSHSDRMTVWIVAYDRLERGLRPYGMWLVTVWKVTYDRLECGL